MEERKKLLFSREEEKLDGKRKEKAEEIAREIAVRMEEEYSEEEVRQAERKAEAKYKGKRQLAAIWDRIRILFIIAKHPKVWGPGVAVPAAAAVLYLVLPVDAVPDLLPGAGLLDDIAVITASVSVMVRNIRKKSARELAAMRDSIPAILLPTFDSMFPQETDAEEVVPLTQEEILVDETERLASRIIGGVEGAGRAVEDFREKLEEKAALNPRLRRSFFYRAAEKAGRVSDAISLSGETVARNALRAALSAMLLKKEVKSLVSFSLFALSLLLLYIAPSDPITLGASSLLMLSSYFFLLKAFINAVPRISAFFKGLGRGGIEDGFTAFVLRECRNEPGMKEILVKAGIREAVKRRDAVMELFLSFRKELLFFILKMALVALSFFLLKRLSLSIMGSGSTFSIIFAPLSLLLSTL